MRVENYYSNYELTKTSSLAILRVGMRNYRTEQLNKRRKSPDLSLSIKPSNLPPRKYLKSYNLNISISFPSKEP